MATKAQEIKLIDRIRAMVEDGSTYLSDLITPEMCHQMVGNIRNDFTIDFNVPLIRQERLDKVEADLIDQLEVAARKRVTEYEEAQRDREQIAWDILNAVDDGFVSNDFANRLAQRLVGIVAVIVYNVRRNNPLTADQETYLKEALGAKQA